MLNLIKKVTHRFDATSMSGLINMCLKPISMILSLVYTPLLLHYLGDTKYGLWVTMLSIVNWVNYFDVGIGNGLRHILAKEFANSDYEQARRSISTAYIILTVIAFILLIALVILTQLVDWHIVFSTDYDMRTTIMISFIFICVNFVLAISNTILYALQLSERVALRGCLVQVINIVGLLFINSFSTEKIEYMAILFGFSSMIVYLGNTVSIFARRKYLIPSISQFEKTKIKAITNVGIKFFVIQIMCLLLFTTDDLLITHYFGAAEVTPFSIANKLFNTVFTLFAAFVVPYWSRATVAFEKKDIAWLHKCQRQVFAVCAFFICCYAILLCILRPIVNIWMGKDIDFAKGLPEIMCIFYCIYTIMSAECQFINGSGRINTQLVVYCVIGVLNIPLSIYLGVTLQLGVVGIRLATTILVLLETIILAINLKQITHSAQTKSIVNSDETKMTVEKS